jgi:hypothetical protein
MSPKPWRALRALRVVLACLVLWLPARGASASLVPADAVVMMAGARGTATAETQSRASDRASSKPRARASDAERRHAKSGTAATLDRRSLAEDEHRDDRSSTANRSVDLRPYLSFCVFLR